MTRGRALLPPGPDTGSRRGFALLIVLFALVLLALIGTHITAAGRSEIHIATNLVGNAEAGAAADGAIYEAAFRLLDTGGDHWEADGAQHKLKVSQGLVTVRILSEAGKINPNTATPELLQSLLHVLGLEQGAAAKLAAAIADWREPGDEPRPNGAKQPQYVAAHLDHAPPDDQIESIDELGRVLGMTPDLLAALRPHLSLFQDGLPDPHLADPVVRAALQQLPTGSQAVPALPAVAVGLQTVTITAEAETNAGARFTRRATLRVGAGSATGFTILAWEQPGAE